MAADGATPLTERRTDVLSGDLRRTILVLALPVFAQQLLAFCVGFFDTYLSGRISSDATSAIGLGAYVGWLASMLFGLVGAGTTALVARHWGRAEYEQAGRITNRSMALSVLMGATFCVMIWATAPGFATLLDMQGDVRQITIRYLRIDGLGHIFTSLVFVGAAALRGSGDMRTPMWILGTVNIVNMALSSIFVYGLAGVPKLGVDGIVLGTVLARFAGGVLMLAVLARGVGGLKLDRSEWKVRGRTVRRILRIGGPAAVDGAVMWGGQFLFLMVIANLASGGMDSNIFAAHIIGVRVEALTYLPATAWGYAAATVVGQSLGAERRQRALAAGHEATLQCCLLGVAITAAFFFGADAIYALMHKEAAVREIGAGPFRMVALFQIPLIASITYILALRGAGDTRYPLLITTLSVLGVRVPVAWVCGVVLAGGLYGAWIGMCADMGLRGLLAFGRFARRRWMDVRV